MGEILRKAANGGIDNWVAMCDVVTYLDQLPIKQGDEHLSRQFLSLCVCAFNVA